MLRIAIVGCGKIADQHVHAIHRIANCEIVAVCDQELLMAQQLAEFQIPECFADLEEMLKSLKRCRPHYCLAESPSLVRCLEAGAHVYVEKPRLLLRQMKPKG
jgi:predicted dehydrogenase